MGFKYIRHAAFAAGLLFAADLGTHAQPPPAQPPSASAAKTLPFVSPIFGDNLFLQRGKPNTIWGWSDPVTMSACTSAQTQQQALPARIAAGSPGFGRRRPASLTL